MSQLITNDSLADISFEIFNALTQRLQSRWPDFPSQSIGTVHTFQGGQKSVIIFSTRQCSATDSLWFINRRPNLRGGCCQQSARIVYPGGKEI